MSIDEFNDLMGTKLENEDYDTLGGFLYAQLDKIPVAGDTITFEHHRFTIASTRGRRIVRVEVELLPKEEAAKPAQHGPNPPPALLPPPSDERSIVDEKSTDRALQQK